MPVGRGLAVAGLVAVVPATLGARLYLEVRNRLSDARERRAVRPAVRAGVVVLAAALAGAVVARYPLTAGNGMDSLRHVAPTVSVVGAVARRWPWARLWAARRSSAAAHPAVR